MGRLPRQTALRDLCRACNDGDFEQLEALLDFSDPVAGFHGDLNEHLLEYNALHFAASHGELECVQALLQAGVDPHVRTRRFKAGEEELTRHGPDHVVDGQTARELADEFGWDEVASMLADAEAEVAPGFYVRSGPLKNAKIYPSKLTSEGKDPVQVKMLEQKYRPSLQNMLVGRDIAVRTAVGLLFPGQGSQYVGMLQNVKENPKVLEMAEAANTILGWNVVQICLEGPGAKLDSAEYGHVALYFAGAVALELLRRRDPSAARAPGGVAGYGAGELTALLAAEVVSFEDGLRLAKVRGRAMEAASRDPPQALLSVAGLACDKVERLCAEIESSGKDAVCRLSSRLFRKGATCAGTASSVEKLAARLKDEGALQAKVVHCGAFHTPLMTAANQEVQQTLTELLPRMRPPSCDVFMNCTGGRILSGSSPRLVVKHLIRQMTEPILWEACIQNMMKAGVCEFHELGPMKQLKSILKRIDPVVYERAVSVEV